MGIGKSAARLLLDEFKRRPFNGSVMELGRQTMFFTLSELKSWADIDAVCLREVINPSFSNLPQYAAKGILDDTTFFKAIGFETVHSCDVSDYEGCTYQLNLNYDVPESFHNRYDLIYDGGTCEHIFHFPNVLKNIHLMLKPGGRIIHSAPSSNHVDHGFYMFSPMIFHDYYSINRYDIEASYLFNYTSHPEDDPWMDFYHYQPGCLDASSLGGFDKGLCLAIWLIATKGDNATTGLFPLQGHSQRTNNTNYRPRGEPLSLYARY